MPKQVEPQVFIIAKSRPDMQAIADWHTSLGVEYDPELDNLHALNKIYSDASPGDKITAMAGKRCYNSFTVGLNPNVTRIRENIADYIDNILAQMHGSTLEHTSYTFAVENVSRIFTAEMNRHRAGMAISEGSGRYIRFDEIPYWLPPSIQPESFQDFTLRQPQQTHIREIHTNWLKSEDKKAKLRQVFELAFTQMEQNYKELCDIVDIDNLTNFNEKKVYTSLFRRIIGMGAATGGVWTGNLRALRHIFTMRCSPHAEEEIRHVATLMLEAMMQEEPHIFGDFEQVNGYYEPKYKKV